MTMPFGVLYDSFRHQSEFVAQRHYLLVNIFSSCDHLRIIGEVYGNNGNIIALI